MAVLRKYALAIDSILILLTATLMATLLHEGAHYATALSFGLKAEMHHNYVLVANYDTLRQKIIVASAGPLFSLVLGLISLLIAALIRPERLTKLFFNWLGIIGFLGFFGYMMIAPIVHTGDTGFVLQALNVPEWLQILTALLSIAIFILFLYKMAPRFAAYKSAGTFDKMETANQLFTFPIYALVIFGTLLNLPAPYWESLLPAICVPFSFFTIFGGYKKMAISNPPTSIETIPVPLVALTLLVIAVFRIMV